MGCNSSSLEAVGPPRIEATTIRNQNIHSYADEVRPIVYIPLAARPQALLNAENDIHYSPATSPTENKEEKKKLTTIPETDIFKPHEFVKNFGTSRGLENGFTKLPTNIQSQQATDAARSNPGRGASDKGHVAHMPSNPVSFRQSSPLTNVVVQLGTTASQLLSPNPLHASRTGTFHDFYVLSKELGKGSFARVHVCVERETKKEWAVKHIVDRKKMRWNGRDALVDELVTLEKLRKAPNVVYMHDHFVGKNSCHVVLELLHGNNLLDWLMTHGTLSERDARKACECILKALKYMHKHRVTHRDLKPENILLADASNLCPVKISDFGFSKTLTRKNGCQTLCGTPGYMAPEILERWPAYDVKVDVWSFGVLLFLLLGGCLPFDEEGDNANRRVFERTRKGQYRFHPQRFRAITEAAKALIRRCLTVDPNLRVCAELASNHSWMKNDQLPKQQSSAVTFAESTSQTSNEGGKHPDHMQRAQALHDAVSTLHSDSLVSQFMGNVADTSNAAPSTTTLSAFPEESASGKLFSEFYDKCNELGKWGFVTMFSCIHRQTRKSYSLKEVENTKMSETQKTRLKEEIDILQFLRGGPHITRLIDVFHETNTTFMILEEVKGGNLLHRIVDREDYTEHEARQICKALFHAVNFCHQKRIAHRDIKLDNILLQEKEKDVSLKLTGFDFSKKVGKDPLTTMCGTAAYVAPEVFLALHGGYDFRCDMWSVGVVVYVLVAGYFPFEGVNAVAIAQKAIHNTVYFHPDYWNQASDSVRTLVGGLLERNVHNRLSADDALKSRWIQMEDDGVLHSAELSETKSKLGELGSKESIRSVGLSGNESLKLEDEFDSAASFESASQLLNIHDANIDVNVKHNGFVDVDALNEKEFWVKTIVRRDLPPEKLIALSDEIEVLRTLAKCDNAAVTETLIQLRSVHDDINATYLVFSRIHGEWLSERLQRQKKIPESETKRLVESLLSGISYCHSKYIAIRNLTLNNLLLAVHQRDNTERITITDFALSKRIVFKNTLHTLCGTLEFVAPEMLQSILAYDVECDMWAVGVIVYIMLSGHHPFDAGPGHDGGNPQEEMLKRIRYGEYAFRSEKGWSEVSLEATSLLERMLTVNPDERVTASEALSDAWIKK